MKISDLLLLVIGMLWYLFEGKKIKVLCQELYARNIE